VLESAPSRKTDISRSSWNVHEDKENCKSEVFGSEPDWKTSVVGSEPGRLHEEPVPHPDKYPKEYGEDWSNTSKGSRRSRCHWQKVSEHDYGGHQKTQQSSSSGDRPRETQRASTGSSTARSSTAQRPWRKEAPAEGRSRSSWDKKAASEAGSGVGSTTGSSWHIADPPSIGGSEADWRVPPPNVVEKRPRSLSDGEKAEAGVSREAGSGTYKTPEAQGCKVSRQKMNALQVAGTLSEAEVATDRSASRERERRGRPRRGSSSSSDGLSVVPNCASNAFGRFTRLTMSRSPTPARQCRGTHKGAKGSGKGKAKGKGGRAPFYARQKHHFGSVNATWA
jgi:hypothetical protein